MEADAARLGAIRPEPEAPRRSPCPRAGLRLAALALVAWLAWRGLDAYRLAQDDLARLDGWLDAQAETYRAVPPLTAGEEAALRRSLNPAHLRAAERLGVEPVAAPESLAAVAARRGLVRIGTDTTRVVWQGGYSEPFLTPDAAISLDSIAFAFRRELDRAGLPAFRFTLSSVWRATEAQAALRRVNPNAARGRSSHEYATTFDIPYRRFSFAGPGSVALPEPSERLPPVVRPLVAEVMGSRAAARFDVLARDEPQPLAALLGRALIELEDRGVVVALIERQQPVYHVTVARPLADVGD